MTFALWLSIAASTLVSEDLACVAAGALLQQGLLSPIGAVSGCAAGIFAGDLGLWALGRAGGGFATSQSWIATHVLPRAQALGSRYRRGTPLALVASRFVPGTRLPLYVTCGLVGIPLRTFALCVGGAVLVWTPLVVFGSAGLLGVALRAVTDRQVVVTVVASAFVAGAVTGRRLLGAQCVKRPLRRVVERVRRWEFWPMWVFYAPLVPWLAWLSLRYGGPTTVTAANPGIVDGGTVGESKAAILACLPPDAVLPFRRIDAMSVADRVTLVEQARVELGLTYPCVLKPDVGERGRGVRIAHDRADVEAFCATCREPFVVQQYHPGPYEAGVFYYRMPGEARGRVLSITDKRFPVVIGDGRSTLAQLVEQHPRYRMQASVFLARHAPLRDQVLADGARVQLAQAGNHSKGTMFLDGEWLRSAALEARIDAIALAYPGFCIGRFDIRYADPQAFRAGRDLAIVELNGATAEPTDLYDPSRSLLTAYRLLFRQWTLVFQIGAANRHRGAATTPVARLVAQLRAHWRAPALAAD